MSRNVVITVAVFLAVLGVGVFLTMRGGAAPEPIGTDPGPAEATAGESGARGEPAPAGAEVHDPERAALPDADLGHMLPDGFGVVGTVRSVGGEPAPGSAVWLLRADREQRIASTTADERGRFAFPLGFGDDAGLPGFRVSAHHPDHGLATPVVVPRPEAGESVRVDVVLDVEGLAIAGVVRGPAGDPVPDHAVALVRADDAPEAGPEWRAGRSQVEIVTRGDGSFVARGLRVGTWEVDFEAPDAPVGFDVEPPPLRVLTAAGAADLELRVPFVRVRFDVLGADGRPRKVDSVSIRAFDVTEAEQAEVRFENREDLDAPPLYVERRRREDARDVTVWAAPGSFLIASAADGGSISELGLRVEASPAVRQVPVTVRATAATTVLRLQVLRPDGSAPDSVLFRVRRPDGLLVAPPELEDVGGGWRRLPGDGRITVPPGRLSFELLGDAFDAGRSWYPTSSLPAEFEWNVPPPPTSDARTVRLQAGAWVEVEIAQADAPPTAAARAAWRDERLPGDVPVVKGYASIEPTRGPERALRLAWITPDGTWRALLGVPYRPGETVVLRALGVFEPGPCRFAIQTWRPATVEDSAGWPLDLLPGRNVIRLRMDADAVLHGPVR